jgi:hypothetical protein
MKQKDIAEIAKKNPQVDLAKFEEARKQIEALRRMGVKDAQYNLSSPFAGKIAVLNLRPTRSTEHE